MLSARQQPTSRRFPLLQATYYTFTDAEEKLIVRGQRQGMTAVLDSPEASGKSMVHSPSCASSAGRGCLSRLTVHCWHEALPELPPGLVPHTSASPVDGRTVWATHPSLLQGRSMNPSLRRLLQSGMVSVRVARADGLPLSSLFGRPSV